MNARPKTLGYLTSVYARASDTFIRGEVAQLRALGHTVHTFSIRQPTANELISEEVRRERAATEDLVAAGPARLVAAGLGEALQSPRRFLAAARLAQRVGTPGLRGRLWPQAYLLEAAYLARRMRAKGVQHLHNHIGEGSAAVAMLASVLSGIPFSMTVHGPNEFDRPTLLALGEKIKHSAFTVAISNFGRSQLYRWSHHEDWSKIEVVRCGVDDSFLIDNPVPIPEAPRLVCVGRLAEQKGQLLLIRAAALLRDRGIDLELTLIGDGPMRTPIERSVQQLDLGDRVRLLGWMNAAEVRREILASRALVLPSFAEGLPVVLMEALAMGRPVITTTIAGIPELVESGVCGWLVPAGSVEPLADAMHEALTATPGELEGMGRAGHARVARLHDAATEAAKLSNLFSGHRPAFSRPSARQDTMNYA